MSQQRGHPNYLPGQQNKRKCVLCHRRPTRAGHDPCIPDLPGVEYACCGHGVTVKCYLCEDGVIRMRPEPGSRLMWHTSCYVVFRDGVALYGRAARAAMEMLGGNPPPLPEQVSHFGPGGALSGSRTA